jgi:hypothetical protein
VLETTFRELHLAAPAPVANPPVPRKSSRLSLGSISRHGTRRCRC